MTFHSSLILTSLLATFFAGAAAAADRETLSIGREAPSVEKIKTFLFPEADCEHESYTCMALRPSVDRAVGMEVRFETNSADLTPAGRAQLDALGKLLASRKLAPGEIVIEGHADARGGADLNKRLSQQRAEAVIKHLVVASRVDPKALTPLGRGKEQLKDADRPDSEVNRRVELVRKAN